MKLAEYRGLNLQVIENRIRLYFTSALNLSHSALRTVNVVAGDFFQKERKIVRTAFDDMAAYCGCSAHKNE